MLNEFDIINMNRRSLSRSGESNGRLYDPVLGRFFSPDNYVQLPDYSQSFNRYSYCLNNPLKYTDPSGNLFGIDDAIIAFAVFNMASSMMQASFNGQSVWKAGALSLFLLLQAMALDPHSEMLEMLGMSCYVQEPMDWQVE